MTAAHYANRLDAVTELTLTTADHIMSESDLWEELEQET